MSADLTTIGGTLVAALVAGAISYLAGRGMKTHEWRLTLAKEELATRKVLYASFLAEAQRLMIKATESKAEVVSDFDLINRQYAEITLVASPTVAEAARHLLDSALLAQQQGEAPAAEVKAFYPRKEAFLLAARRDLSSFREA